MSGRRLPVEVAVAAAAALPDASPVTIAMDRIRNITFRNVLGVLIHNISRQFNVLKHSL